MENLSYIAQIQLYILTALNYIPTLFGIYLFWQWRRLTGKPLIRAAFTVIPILLSIFAVYRVATLLGFESPETLVVVAYFYVANNFLMVFMFWLATRIVKARHEAAESEKADVDRKD